MKQFHLVALVAAVVVSQSGPAIAQQQGTQSLSDSAHADTDRRATAETRPPVRLLTNADLKPGPRPEARTSPPLPAPIIVPPVTVSAAPAIALQTEAYWKDRMRALALELEATAGRAAGASDHLSGLQASYVGADYLTAAIIADNIFETRSALNEHLAAFQSVKAAMAALEEEARRAGVPPGWLRLP